MRMNPLGNRKTSSVHTALKKAAAISAYFSAARMRPHLPAPKLAERMGWAAWPTLYAQHWDHGAHVHDHTVHGQCVRAQSLQDLAVEQHGQDAHGDVEKERGKAGGQNLPQLGSGISEADGRSVQRREKKWDSITVKVMPEPMAVASPAPNTPMSQVNTKK